ncbi:MAG: sigma-70 family RNA polymerase sigma factor [Planctomycetota bacterium]
MTDSPATRATLLLRLRDAQDTDAWSQFVRDYGPMLYRFLRGRGLQDADATDLVQDVMRSVGMSISRLDYDRQKGGFRAWLFTITRNKLYSYFEKQSRTENGGGNTDRFEQLNNTPADNDELSDEWELEYQRQLAARAMETIRQSADPKTWAAFQLTAIEGIAAAEAGETLGMSAGAVYVARSRVTAKLREEVQNLMNQEEMRK